MSGEQEQITLKGYIVALPRHAGGEEGARAALRTEDGLEYRILPKGMGLDLAAHINARVEVTGLVRHKEDPRLLQVRKYIVDDAFEDDWYDDNS
ncbi:MAG: hypothetical protein LBD82_04870 [Deltaproteobacteria bacterium]|jgi:hypothetical protein|nr:hypothetical protein [Deltaproteobacteria bacterium]